MEKVVAEFAPPFAKDRKPLHTLLPLAAPLSVYLDPSSYCNFKCKFCCQHFASRGEIKLVRNFMSIDLLDKLAEDFAEFEEPVKIIHVFGTGEPLLNPELINFIRILKSKLSDATQLEVTTNATRLSKKVANEIVDSGLDKIVISIYGLNNEQYFKNCGVKVNFDRIRENCEYLFSVKKNMRIHIKSMVDLLSKEEQEKFITYFGQYCDTIYLDNIINCWPGIKATENHQAHMYNISGQSDGKKICSLPFYQMLIHSNGKVSACCVDTAQNLIMGDATKNKLTDIWNGDIWRNLRLNILENRKINSICASCEYIETGMTVDITPHRQQLLQKYLELS